MNPVGRRRYSHPPSAISPAYRSRITTGIRIAFPTTRAYPCPAARNTRLNPQKNQPNSRLNARVNRSWRTFFGLSNTAHRAGQSVRELSVEIVVEIAIVSANWRKNWPTIPDRNAHGMNTANSTAPTATTGPDTSLIAWIVAAFGAR